MIKFIIVFLVEEKIDLIMNKLQISYHDTSTSGRQVSKSWGNTISTLLYFYLFFCSFTAVAKFHDEFVLIFLFFNSSLTVIVFCLGAFKFIGEFQHTKQKHILLQTSSGTHPSSLGLECGPTERISVGP